MSARDAQLARIAAVAPPPPEPAVKIYKLDKGVSIWMWLCQPCLGERLAKGWAHLETRRPPFAVECQDCRFKREHGL